MKPLIYKYNLIEKRWEDMRTIEDVEVEADELWQDHKSYSSENSNLAQIGLAICLLKGEACVVEQKFIYSLSRESIETYLKEKGE